ncbi:MAG: 3-deoxy-D-manno-octulosonic acid transferase [Arenibacter sp.]|nr:3-deoxy-D-manno-octulosonic acid transferase [Arenibacter sp.]
MYFLYNFAITIAWYILKIPALFNKKIALFISGRKTVFPYLEEHISKKDLIIWMHTASLGEYEQGLPLLQKLKKTYPEYSFLVTFFSPSGYEVKKNSKEADFITYLPFDTVKNVDRFLETVTPKMAIFVKYEIWPNYFRKLQRLNIPILLVSGIFNEKQVYFKSHGGFMRDALRRVSHFFVQNDTSAELLRSIKIETISITGDTRFDRVNEILERDNSLSFMTQFKGEHRCIVAGSTWPEDEKLLLSTIQNASDSVKFVIAPHDIKEEHIQNLLDTSSKKTILYSKMNQQDLSDCQVLIIDTIGLLTKIYSYADIAYVGGGFATGLHNTLEPAVFGVPVIIGPQYNGFKEAEDMVAAGGIKIVTTKEELVQLIDTLLADFKFRTEVGLINSTYIEHNTGASDKIVEYINGHSLL